MALSSSLSEADLHGLIDGHLEPDRRVDVLRRAASSPRDRAAVEAWQSQADLIRAAFAAVPSEPLPRALDLRTCLELKTPSRLSQHPPEPERVPRRRGWTTAATLIAVAAGMAGSWYVATLPLERRMPPPLSSGEDGSSLVERTAASLVASETAEAPAALVESLPTSSIPDLSGSGFAFTGAAVRGSAPGSLVFAYRGPGNEHVAVGAVRATAADGGAGPLPRDGGYAWHSGRVAYAIFGTVAPDRLRDMAVSLAGSTRDASGR